MCRRRIRLLFSSVCVFLTIVLFFFHNGDVDDRTRFNVEKNNLYMSSLSIQINLQDAVSSAYSDLYLPLVSAKHSFSLLPDHVAAFTSIYRKYDERFGPLEKKVEAAFVDYEVFFDRYTNGEPLTKEEYTYLTDLAAACKGLCGAIVKEDGTYRKEIKKQAYMLEVLENFCDALPEAPPNSKEGG